MTADIEYRRTHKRFVVCAAVRVVNFNAFDEGDIIFCSARHFDMNMHRQMHACYGKQYPETEQGFIDQHGVFMTREEAMIVARKGGQKIDIKMGCGGSTTTLYSEGLY